ncbi:BON domain-containing protein [Legionella hackeliae]|uniref:Periplasmic protein n=1 Tax=Legionella hackeliae TaxID=449 RepID=A0A0A8UTN8_LEGHA|nr:BON domain-containing protein [Legionella hackeliae]KTD12801.1 Periplasmic protein [Legionella hackeliae]CEK12225.1 Periplasmic protein [Legionella hackeliae]STX49011.1 21 kDa hemolysin precursor [Legionella hackeliae]
MKIRAFIFLLISALLTSCVAVVVAGAAAGLVVYDRRSISSIESDARIFHVIHKEIVTTPGFQDSRVLVSSFNQVVLLVGQVPTASLRGEAEKIAQNTPHVRRVYNEVTVDFPIPLSQRTKDTWITSQVRSLMLTKKGLESGSIRIVTENGVVYLMGIVTHEQSDLAVSVARQINGVQKVVKVFQYIV